MILKMHSLSVFFVISLFFMSSCFSLPRRSRPETEIENPDLVVLLHGLGRTRYSLRKIQKSVVKEGYEVINSGYKKKRNDEED